jgi:hypothetical protein
MHSNIDLRRVNASPTFGERPDIELKYRVGELIANLDDDVSVSTMTFDVVQAVRLTTWDAYPNPGSVPGDAIYEVVSSEWIAELKRAVLVNEASNFLENSHHYILGCVDDVLEVVSWSVSFGEWE